LSTTRSPQAPPHRLRKSTNAIPRWARPQALLGVRQYGYGRGHAFCYGRSELPNIDVLRKRENN